MDKDMPIDATPRRKLNFDEADREKELTNANGDEQTNERQLNIPIEIIPKIGMEFECEDAAYKFYNEYAKATGFGIQKHSVHKDRNGRVLDRIFCCECQGRRGKDKRDAMVKSHSPETRTCCEARYKGKYRVVNFIAKHIGHDLVSLRKSHMKRSYRKISDMQASQVDDLDSSGITPKEGFALLSKQVGNRENVGFTYQDFKNYLGLKKTMEIKVGDTGGVLEYLQQRQLDDPNFFYVIQVDQDDLIANILWVDAQIKVDFSYFRDVVCFDTTYGKNKEGKPFSLFVGMNHHRQTIIFSASLLYDETTSTYTWLFDTFARAMSGKLPKTILTDQDAAMAKALAIQWPETCHRLCIWHIFQNAAKHLSNVLARFKSFSKDFRSCVYDYEEEEEFLNTWNVMLEKYELKDNDWLERLFKIREKWALDYGRKLFCADMITTQRSESMNSVLKRYVNYKHNLCQFLHHFDRLVDDRRYEELKADFRTSQTIPMVVFPVQICKHAASNYTHEVLELFHEECARLMIVK